MLVLTRKINERILIGDGIEITVLKTSGGRVKLGINADAFISIRRAEVCDDTEVSDENHALASSPQRQVTMSCESF